MFIGGVRDCEHGEGCAICETVYHAGRPIGEIVDERKLTQEQLCEAIQEGCMEVVRRPDGLHDLIYTDDGEYYYGPAAKEEKAA
jgi:hypothetical protein